MKTIKFNFQGFKSIVSTFCFLLLIILNLTAQSLPNSGFEQVDSNQPLHWSCDIFGASSSTTSNTGNYSLSVWNWYSHVIGYAVNGYYSEVADNYKRRFYKAGVPITGKPSQLVGYYKYDTTGFGLSNDSAVVAVLLKKYNNALNKIDTIGFGRKHLPATPAGEGFKFFEVNIEDMFPGIIPDSIVIVFLSSVKGQCFGEEYCLYLYIDDLSLYTSTGMMNTMNMFSSLKAYPNPTKGRTTIDLREKPADQLIIYDIYGRIIQNRPVHTTTIDINLEENNKGIYFLQTINNGNITGCQKIMVE